MLQAGATPARLPAFSRDPLRHPGANPALQAHACIGGKSVGDDMRKLEAGVHIVSGTPGRVFDMIKRRSLRTRCAGCWLHGRGAGCEGRRQSRWLAGALLLPRQQAGVLPRSRAALRPLASPTPARLPAWGVGI